MKRLALLLPILALAAAPACAEDPATNAPSRSVLANAFAAIRAGVAEAAKGGFDFETLDLSTRRVLRTCEERPGCFPWDFVRDVRPFGEDAPAKDVFGVVFLGSDDGRPFPGRTIALFHWTSPATTRILRFAGDLTADEPPVHDPLALLYDFAVRRVDLDDDPEHPTLRLDGVYVHDDIPAKLDLEIGADGDFVAHEAPRTPAEDLAILRRWCWRVPFVRTTFPEPWQISAVPGYVDRVLERLKRGGGDAHVPALALLLLREYDHQIENRNPRYYTNFPCLPWRVVRPLDAWLRDHGATWGADPTSGDLANAVLERRETLFAGDPEALAFAREVEARSAAKSAEPTPLENATQSPAEVSHAESAEPESHAEVAERFPLRHTDAHETAGQIERMAAEEGRGDGFALRVEERTNSLLFFGSDSDREFVRHCVGKLDVPQAQVVLENSFVVVKNGMEDLFGRDWVDRNLRATFPRDGTSTNAWFASVRVNLDDVASAALRTTNVRRYSYSRCVGRDGRTILLEVADGKERERKFARLAATPTIQTNGTVRLEFLVESPLRDGIDGTNSLAGCAAAAPGDAIVVGGLGADGGGELLAFLCPEIAVPEDCVSTKPATSSESAESAE